MNNKYFDLYPIEIFLLCLLVVSLVGCATDPATYKMALDAQAAQRPTLAIKCPSGGCEVEYTDPRDRQNIKLPANGYDAYAATLNTVGQIISSSVVPVAMGVVAVKGFENMKASNVTTTTTNTDASNRSSTVGAVDNSTTTGAVSTTTTGATTTTTTTTTTGAVSTDRHDTTTGAVSTDSHNVTTTTSSTATPTVTTTRTCSVNAAGNLECLP